MTSLQSPFSFSFPSLAHSSSTPMSDTSDDFGNTLSDKTSDAVLNKLQIMKSKLSKLDHGSHLINELKQLIEESYQLIINNNNLSNIGHKYNNSLSKCNFNDMVDDFTTPITYNGADYQTPPPSSNLPYQTPIDKIIDYESTYNIKSNIHRNLGNQPQIIHQTNNTDYLLTNSEFDYLDYAYFNCNHQMVESLFEVNFELE
ncbi:hypothetical protein G9P44_000335 [Scheffersomyces stipitis]|nr:hypothetical protein G9P44_000335 [Scheffersomyces stipitis]